MAGISESPHFGSQPDEGAAYEAGLKTAQDTVEKLNNSIQQLKAEIRAILDDYRSSRYFTDDLYRKVECKMERLRELSAV
jgi:predicted RNase H-like nuclease (RuvC/YqgF family)